MQKHSNTSSVISHYENSSEFAYQPVIKIISLIGCPAAGTGCNCVLVSHQVLRPASAPCVLSQHMTTLIHHLSTVDATSAWHRERAQFIIDMHISECIKHSQSNSVCYSGQGKFRLEQPSQLDSSLLLLNTCNPSSSWSERVSMRLYLYTKPEKQKLTIIHDNGHKKCCHKINLYKLMSKFNKALN